MFQTATEENYEAGQIIVEEGSSGDWIYVVETGAVEISKIMDGKKVVLEVLKPGEVFGELGFITKAKRTATASAVGETTVGIIDRSFLDQEFNKLSASFRAILVALASRLKKATEGTKHIQEAPRGTKVVSLTFKRDDDLMQAFSENVADGEIFVKTMKPLPERERFFLKLRLPDVLETIKIGCEVAWNRAETDDPAKPPGMGIKFIQISQPDMQRLKETLKKADADRRLTWVW
ncbi:MAG: cyclic nucleotide-binding domain-containing protein, partial [Deltaproteobacteria bacterium]|nr:cyclic nucleotide-binding domain-containing protein [Deltaproteobacteria bacterium]